jgi:PAS domain-containing protein
MLFSFVDVEPRRKAEVALRQSEERFAKAFGLTPVPILVCSASDQVVMDVNEAFLEPSRIPATKCRANHRRHRLHPRQGREDKLFSALEKTGRLDRVDVARKKIPS